MPTLLPESPEQLAECLVSTPGNIRLGGNFSKDRLGGAVQPFDVEISTRAMRRLLKYDPRDLTISVETGMRFAELEQILAEHRQMLPLDPGWQEDSTVGGVIAANLSGPRRRLYGTARDMVIGMTFATLEGKLVASGGMVVKNVAGLDMAKLMVGSFGTLAAIAVVNFKVFPVPVESRTFEMHFESAAAAFAERDRILKSTLQPAAIDFVNWPSGFRLLVRAGGNAAVLDRFARDLPQAEVRDESVWNEIRNFTPQFLAGHPQGAVRTIAVTHTAMPEVIGKLNVPVIARAASGVIYAHFAENPPAATVEGDLVMMKKVKAMFDPQHRLNPGRLHGCI